MSVHPEFPELTEDDELRNGRLEMQIYEAIVVAASDAHAVLDSVLGAADPEAARRALEVRFGFTETQAWAVMDVQFRRLTSADRSKIEQRQRDLAARVAALEEGLVGE